MEPLEDKTMAEQILNGDCCQLCGSYFISEGDGYPRSCAYCLGDSYDEIDLDLNDNDAY